jgi:hypothetical protein
VCDDGGYADQADVQSVRSDASPPQAGRHAARQQQHGVAAEDSSASMLDGGNSKSWGTAAAAKTKRGGYKVRAGTTGRSAGILLPSEMQIKHACWHLLHHCLRAGFFMLHALSKDKVAHELAST